MYLCAYVTATNSLCRPLLKRIWLNESRGPLHRQLGHEGAPIGRRVHPVYPPKHDCSGDALYATKCSRNHKTIGSSNVVEFTVLYTRTGGLGEKADGIVEIWVFLWFSNGCHTPGNPRNVWWFVSGVFITVRRVDYLSRCITFRSRHFLLL